MGAAQAPSRDHRRFHNAALTRSPINESVETVGQKNTSLRGDHHGAQGGSKLRPTEENEIAYDDGRMSGYREFRKVLQIVLLL